MCGWHYYEGDRVCVEVPSTGDPDFTGWYTGTVLELDREGRRLLFEFDVRSRPPQWVAFDDVISGVQ